MAVDRPQLIPSYIENTVKYLMMNHPEIPPTPVNMEKVETYVKEVIRARITRPKASTIVHSAPGEYTLQDVDLLGLIKKSATKVITPSGSIFKTTDEYSAFSTQMVDDKIKQRSVIKKEMLELKAKSMFALAKLKDYAQGACKITTNSIIGAHGSKYSALYDLECFNAITSLSRHAVMTAYGYTENFLCANYYFPNVESLINHVITISDKAPPADEIMKVVNRYRLHIPSYDEVAEFLLTSLRKYVVFPPTAKIHELISRLPTHKQIFLFYNRNLKNLFQTGDNSDMFRNWITELCNEKNVDEHENVDAEDLFKLDGDLLQFIATIYNNYLKGKPIHDLPEENPEVAKRLVRIGRYMQRQIDSMNDLFTMFLYTDTFIAQVHLQKNMARNTVILSDTDSVIYTTIMWVMWYTQKEFSFDDPILPVHSFVVYILAKSISTLVYNMCIRNGASPANAKRLKIKNEYLYFVMIICDICKHYLGNIAIQEGKVLPEPDLDIKGVNFRNSKLPKITHNFTKSCITGVLADIQTTTKISGEKYIGKAVDYELSIYNSLMGGELTYVSTSTIKYKDEYKKPEASIYFNYLLWQEVFAESYDTIPLPNKVPTITLKENLIRKPEYLQWLSANSPVIYERLIKYLDKIDIRKNITRIPIAPSLSSIPKEIIPLIDRRKIIYENLYPVQLLLKSFNINLGNNGKRTILFCDIYSDRTL